MLSTTSLSSGIQRASGAVYAAGAGACGIGANLFTRVGAATNSIFASFGGLGASSLKFTKAHPIALGAVVCMAAIVGLFKAYQKYCPAAKPIE